METYLVNSKLFPPQFDVIDGDSYGIMTHDELEDDYFTRFINDIHENEIQYHEFQHDPQEQLSQQLSQLSMNNKNDDDSIPTYLQDELDKLTCTINRKDLRHVAYILYEIGHHTHLKDLWSLYLQAGLGQLLSIEHEEPYWFYHETLIRQRLHDYQIKLDSYRREYDSCKMDTNLQHVIEKLVNEYGLIEIHMESQYTIALLYNTYHDHQLQVQYRKEASTKYQVDIGQQIFDTSFQLSTMKHELVYHRLQLLYDQPPRSYDTLEFPLLSMDLYEKLLQQTKTQLMALRLLCLQANIYQYETKLKLQTNEMYKNHQQQTVGKTMDQRIELMHQRMKLKLDFHTNYHLRSRFHQDDDHNINRRGFINNLEIDSNRIKNYFNQEQLKLLQRGPSYVAPCQLHLKSMNQWLEKQYQPLQQQLLVDLVKKYPNDQELFHTIEEKTKEEFYKLFSLSDHTPSTFILERAYYERQLISTIQQCLHTHQLILRRIADHTNRFFLLEEKLFNEQCEHYMKQHQDDYELLSSISNMETIVHQHMHRINRTLKFLEQKHSITKDIYQQLLLQRKDIQLKHVYFLFDRSYVKPIFSMESNVTWKLSTFLDDLLRPTMEDILKDSFVDQDVDFIQRLHHHQCTSKLQQTTVLVRITIQNCFTLFTHQSTIDRIIYLITKHQSNQPIHHLSMITIEYLLELYLKHTLFIYQDHIYCFNRGMSNQTHFNTLLSSLCLYYWKMKKFDNNQQFPNEFLLQYKNEFFFTWNQSKDNLHTFLDTLNEFYGDSIDMKIEYGRKITIQNIDLENDHGQFRTTMNSTATMILPYVTGYPKVKYQKWFRSTLIRLIQLCTNYQDFTRQRINMEIGCLISGYSHEFIEHELENFNRHFNVNIYQVQTNELIYQQLRSHLLKVPTRKSQSSIIEFTYLYDYGPYHEFKNKFSHIWSTYTNSHPTLSLQQLKILLNVQHLFSLNNLLAQK